MEDTIHVYIKISNAEEEGELQKIASPTLPKWKYFCEKFTAHYIMTQGQRMEVQVVSILNPVKFVVHKNILEGHSMKVIIVNLVKFLVHKYFLEGHSMKVNIVNPVKFLVHMNILEHRDRHDIHSSLENTRRSQHDREHMIVIVH